MRALRRVALSLCVLPAVASAQRVAIREFRGGLCDGVGICGSLTTFANTSGGMTVYDFNFLVQNPSEAFAVGQFVVGSSGGPVIADLIGSCVAPTGLRVFSCTGFGPDHLGLGTGLQRESLGLIIGYGVAPDRTGFTRTEILTLSAVPEPQTWALLGMGLLALGGVGAHRRRPA